MECTNGVKANDFFVSKKLEVFEKTFNSAVKVSFFCNHLLTLFLNALPQVSFQLVSAFDKEVIDFLIYSITAF